MLKFFRQMDEIWAFAEASILSYELIILSILC